MEGYLTRKGREQATQYALGQRERPDWMKSNQSVLPLGSLADKQKQELTDFLLGQSDRPEWMKSNVLYGETPKDDSSIIGLKELSDRADAILNQKVNTRR